MIFLNRSRCLLVFNMSDWLEGCRDISSGVPDVSDKWKVFRRIYRVASND